MTKNIKLLHTLSEEEVPREEFNNELKKRFNEHCLETEKIEKIDEVISKIITDETKDFYQDLPTRDELYKAIDNSENPQESANMAYSIETKDGVEEDILERVKLKLNEKREDKQTLTTFEEIERYIDNNKSKTDKWGFHTLDSKLKVEPKLLFEYITQSLKKEQKEELKAKLDNFSFLLARAKEQGSVGLKENAEQKIVEIEQEMIISTHGYSRYFLQQHIEAIKPLVEDRIANFCKLEDFPRVIPNAPLEKLKEAQKLNVFSEIWILYLDYTGEKAKSTSQKIKEKDPIMFGKIFKNSEKLFYIADWIDEYCDLTLDKFVGLLKRDDPNFIIPRYKGVSPKEVSELFEAVKKREEVLQNTNSRNWRENYANETNKSKPKISFLGKLLNLFK